MEHTDATHVYNTLIGAYIPGCGVPGVENAFAEDAPCLKLYSNALDAYQRLCDRLNVLDEDDDVEVIFQSLLMISQILGEKMFYYGQTAFAPPHKESD